VSISGAIVCIDIPVSLSMNIMAWGMGELPRHLGKRLGCTFMPPFGKSSINLGPKIRPYAKETSISGKTAETAARASDLSVSKARIGTLSPHRRNAACAMGVLFILRPRPALVTGFVNTPTTSCEELCKLSRVGTAISGFPANKMRTSDS